MFTHLNLWIFFVWISSTVFMTFLSLGLIYIHLYFLKFKNTNFVALYLIFFNPTWNYSPIIMRASLQGEAVTLYVSKKLTNVSRNTYWTILLRLYVDTYFVLEYQMIYYLLCDKNVILGLCSDNFLINNNNMPKLVWLSG